MRHADEPDERVGLILLAAGAGKRMQSAIPKQLHPVAGVPMVERVLRAGLAANPAVIALVVSPETAPIVPRLTADYGVRGILQSPARGTGDAARCALEELPPLDRAVVLFADNPLLQPETVAHLLQGARASGARVAILSAILADAAGYGRVVRDGLGRVTTVIERKSDDPEARKRETEINSGIMVVDAPWALSALRSLPPNAETGEYYLTDLVTLAAQEASVDRPWPVVAVPGNPEDAVGVNDRGELAFAESRAWARKRAALMATGVTMRLPETITIDEDVQVGPDTILLPQTQLHGKTSIGTSCEIGPGAVVRDSQIGDRVTIRSSTVEDSHLADDSNVGPYAHLRAGCEIGPRVHIGNFAELKNARLAADVKVGHFSYIGDASLGAETNIGAGTITANFDGHAKHHTEIGARAFIGSDTILRAPISVGDDARTGAGSVVTKDVPAGATVVGIPARVISRGTRNQAHAVEEE